MEQLGLLALSDRDVHVPFKQARTTGTVKLKIDYLFFVTFPHLMNSSRKSRKRYFIF